MSSLEQAFKIAVATLVAPAWPVLSEEFLNGLRSETHTMVRWLIKTAIIIEQAMPKSIAPTITDSMLAIAKGEIAQKDYYWFGAHICQSDLNFRLTKGFPTWNGMKFFANQVHRESISFGIHLNHLGLLLIRCPGALPGFAGKLKLPDGRLCTPLINGQRPAISKYSCAYTFPSFDGFLDSVEVWATQPPQAPS